MMNTDSKPLFVFAFILILYSTGCLESKEEAVKKDEPDYMESLRGLGYLDYVSAEQDTQGMGVSLYARSQTYPGYNLYANFKTRNAFLIGMDGRILHNWSYPTPGIWEHVELDEDGNLYVVPGPGEKSLAKLDWNSNLVWEKKGGYHHDICLYEDRLYAIKNAVKTTSLSADNRRLRDKSLEGVNITIYDTLIEEMTLEGKTIREHSVHEILWSVYPEHKLAEYANISGKTLDVFHTNTIEVIGEDMEVFSKGDIMVSVPIIHSIIVFDPVTEEIKWMWGAGVLDFPHQPTMTSDNNILVFDNGYSRTYSRILEVDPDTKKIVYEYDGRPDNGFYSKTRGGAQKLPNNNYLITETNKGHVFEVTPEGQKVWGWTNPSFNKNNRRHLVYRMTRIKWGSSLFN